MTRRFPDSNVNVFWVFQASSRNLAYLGVKWKTTSVIELLAWLPRHIRTHIQRTGAGEERLVAQFGHVLSPSLFSLFGGVEIGTVLLPELRYCVHAPRTLTLDAARTLLKSSGHGSRKN